MTKIMKPNWSPRPTLTRREEEEEEDRGYSVNEEVLRTPGTKRSRLLRIRKRLLKFLGWTMKKEGLEHLTFTW